MEALSAREAEQQTLSCVYATVCSFLFKSLIKLCLLCVRSTLVVRQYTKSICVMSSPYITAFFCIYHSGRNNLYLHLVLICCIMP